MRYEHDALFATSWLAEVGLISIIQIQHHLDRRNCRFMCMRFRPEVCASLGFLCAIYRDRRALNKSTLGGAAGSGS